MMRRFLLCVIALTFAAGIARASWRSNVRAGDKLYEEGKYNEALVSYLEALQQPGDTSRVAFGLGNILHSQEKFQEAGQAFQGALVNPDRDVRADALYNLGNALVGSQQYAEAVEAYKSALNLKPDQMDYLHNLELAQYLLENPPEQQQQQDQGGDQDQEPQEQDQNQDGQQDQQEQEQENQDQESQEQQDQEQGGEQQEEQQQPTEPQEMSPEDAERLLNALQEDEKEVQENLHKQPVVGSGKGKDW
jgi:tetratricopeptide (TPR) repeat protein